jgi:L-glutamine:scyllo-inosose aminotransferase/L-glutamine:2-deoxy-scyllo-inosose/3-amino-2,3-dideoxy-scyllo-inosose aminotransferase
LITDDATLFENASALRNFESEPKGLVPGTHIVSEFQAAVLRSQLKKLPGRLELMEERAERLRSALVSAGRVIPLARLSGTDRQTFYNFCFRVVGVTNIIGFRRALAMELNLPMAGGYMPLNEVPVLSTKDDRRFKQLGLGLSADLPNCWIAHHQQAVRFPHAALMADESAIDDISRAIEKVLESERFRTSQ